MYLTDVTDAEWQQVKHLIEVKQTGPGPRRSVDLRAVLNAVRYKQHTGCQWRNLPADMPPRSTVHGYYRRWNKNGVLHQVLALLAHDDAATHGEQAAQVNGARPWALQRAEPVEVVRREVVAPRHG